MRRVSKDHGFIISLVLNMAFRPEWVVGAIVLFVLHRIFGISIWWGIITLIAWFVYSLIITCVLFWANRMGNSPERKTVNKNPYSEGVRKVQEKEKAWDSMCPVCGKYRFDEAYEICEICGWENDPVQKKNPGLAGGANALSLNEARRAYQEKLAGKADEEDQ